MNNKKRKRKRSRKSNSELSNKISKTSCNNIRKVRKQSLKQRKNSLSIYDMLFNYDKIDKDFKCPKCEFSCLSRTMYNSHCCDELQEMSIIEKNAKNCQVLEKEITDIVDSSIITKTNDMGNGRDMNIDERINEEENNHEKSNLEKMKVSTSVKVILFDVLKFPPINMRKQEEVERNGKKSISESNNAIKSNDVGTGENMSIDKKINGEEINYEMRSVEEMKAESHVNEVGMYGKSSKKDTVAESKNGIKSNDIGTVEDMSRNEKINYEESNYDRNNLKDIKAETPHKVTLSDFLKSASTYMRQENFKKWDAVSSKEILTRNKLQCSSRDHDHTDSIKLSPKSAATVVVHSRASQEIKKKVTPVNKKEINKTKDSVTQKTKELNRNKNISFSDPLIETPVLASDFDLQKNKEEDEKEKTAINNSERSEKGSIELVLYESIHNDIEDDEDHISYEFYPRYEEVLNERKTLINHEKCSASITDILFNYHNISKDFMCAQCHFSCLTRRMYDSHSCDEYMKSGKGKVKKENPS